MWYTTNISGIILLDLGIIAPGDVQRDRLFKPEDEKGLLLFRRNRSLKYSKVSWNLDFLSVAARTVHGSKCLLENRFSVGTSFFSNKIIWAGCDDYLLIGEPILFQTSIVN